ncbi:MAG: hypothetical protein HOO96_38735 [Polyangiaceae bacterium]|nr:hypothetical protein [Polyangiaceae bacterium]
MFAVTAVTSSGCSGSVDASDDASDDASGEGFGSTSEALSTDGAWGRMVDARPGGGYCLASNLVLEHCNGSASQQWRVVVTQVVLDTALRRSVVGLLQNQATGLCAYNVNLNHWIGLGPCGMNAQQYFVHIKASGRVTIPEWLQNYNRVGNVFTP